MEKMEIQGSNSARRFLQFTAAGCFYVCSAVVFFIILCNVLFRGGRRPPLQYYSLPLGGRLYTSFYIYCDRIVMVSIAYAAGECTRVLFCSEQTLE